MNEQWFYLPVCKGGSTRPWERFNIWMLDPPNYDNSYGINVGSHQHHLATVRALASKPRTEYVARLMSLAPELLEALVEAVFVLQERTGFDTSKLELLISKVKGETKDGNQN